MQNKYVVIFLFSLKMKIYEVRKTILKIEFQFDQLDIHTKMNIFKFRKKKI